MIPQIAIYHLLESLNYYGNILAQNSLLIDSRLGGDPLDVFALDMLHEKLKSNTKTALQMGQYNNKKYLGPAIDGDIMRILSKKELPTGLEKLWANGDLLIIPLLNVEFIEKHQKWEELIIQSFENKSSFSLVTNTIIYSKYLETIKPLIKETNSNIQMIKEE
jgi:hypothetical protein